MHTFVLINKQPTSNIQHADSMCYQVFYLLRASRESTCKRSRDFFHALNSKYSKTKCMNKKYSFKRYKSKFYFLKMSVWKIVEGVFFIKSFVETWSPCIDVYYYSPVGLGSAIKKKGEEISDSLGRILVVLESQLQYFYMSYKNCFSTPWKTKQ